MKRIGSVVLFVAVLLVIGAGGYLLYQGQKAGSPRRGGGGAVSVEAKRVERAIFADTIEAIGTAQANESVTLTARVSETVQRVNFSDGDFVEEGDILLEMTRREETAQLAEARAALREAEQQYERTIDLVQRGNASKAVLDQRVRDVAAAESRVAAAEARVEDRVIRAPFKGLLGLRLVSEGTLVAPGEPITTLDDVSVIKLDFSVPEAFYSIVEKGQPIRARTAAFPSEAFLGQVATVNSRIDPVTRSVTVRAEIPNPDARLKPGMLMTVRLISAEREGLSVPENALVPVGGQQYLFVVEDDQTVTRRAITIGNREPGRVEVTEGVREGELVVTKGTVSLRPGLPVRILNQTDVAAAKQS